MKEIKVTIEGEEYLIDIDKAKELGVLKEDKTIKDFKVGDVFAWADNGCALLIVENGFQHNKPQKYNIAGLNGLYVYSSFKTEGATREQMLKYLNTPVYGLRYVKNINSEIKTLLQDALKN